MFEDPFKRIERLRREMDDLFNNFLKRPEFKTSNKEFSIKEPLSDVIVKNNDIIVTMDLPGIDKKDIILSITDNSVEIKVQKKHEIKVEKKNYLKQERSYSAYHKIISLPTKVNTDEAKAEYRDGVLTIKIPKLTKKVESKTKKVIIK